MIKKKLQDVKFIRFQYNPANAVKKLKSRDLLRFYFQTIFLANLIQQWIIRKSEESDSAVQIENLLAHTLFLVYSLL